VTRPLDPATDGRTPPSVLGMADLQTFADHHQEHTVGLGPLTGLAADPTVTDILVNGGGAVWVDRGCGLQWAAALAGEAQVRTLAVRLASQAGRRLDESVPWVDARLPGGIRLHAVLPPLAPEGTHLSLRLLRSGPRRLDELVTLGAVLPGWAPVLEALVARRAAFLVTGGTGVGKTTLLAALLGLVPAQQRIVLVEDVAELAPDHPHVVRLEARRPNVEGRGAVGLDELVRQALRMRPDRLVVGECRGSEIRELLAALNTGHAGGCGTLHANAAVELIPRLEALGSLAGMSRAAVQAQAGAAVDVVVHLERRGANRAVTELAVLERSRDATLRVLPAAARGADDSTQLGSGWPRLAELLQLEEPPLGRVPIGELP
jgi:pilus assembly protein CpaF